MRRKLPIVATLALVASLTACTGVRDGGDRSPSLVVFVAASLTDAMQEVGEAYAATRPVDIAYNFASSGALAQQLLAAPRADMFLSASERWMDEVEAGDRLVPDSRRTLLSNSLVLIANASSGAAAGSPELLCAPEFTYLAIGDPDSVPAGRYAREWLRAYICSGGASAWDRVSGRISPTPDVRAALAQVEGSVDVIGVVYRTDYLSRQDGVRLLYEVPVGEGPEISYPVALVRDTRKDQIGRDFLEFLGGAEARRLFERHGFTVVARSPEP